MLREIFKSIFSRNDISLAIVAILFLLLAMYIMITVFANTVVDIANLSQLGEAILNVVLAMGTGYWCGREFTYAAIEIENVELEKTKENTNNE